MSLKIGSNEPYEPPSTPLLSETGSNVDLNARITASAMNCFSWKWGLYIIVGAVTTAAISKLSSRQIFYLPSPQQAANIPISLSFLVNQSTTHKQNRKEENILGNVDGFVNRFWDDFKIPSVCKEEKNKDFLIDKIASFLKNSQAPEEWNKQVCQNILTNFIKDLQLVARRATTDCQTISFRKDFDFPGAVPSVVMSITVLGKETHNQGKNVYLIVLAERKRKIVYKPRSMLPEKLIYHSEHSLFAKAGLGTYTVYSQKQQNRSEEYSYCDFLDYSEEGSTFHGVDQLKSYYEKIVKIEGFAKALQLTDLHAENIIIHNKEPFIIDMEAILQPRTRQFNTGLLSGNYAGAYEFTSESCNRLFLDEMWIPEKAKVDLENRLTSKTLEAMILYWDDLVNENLKFALKNHSKHIEEIKKKLTPEYVRVIPIQTSDLKNVLYLPLDAAKENLLKDLSRGLHELGFQLINRKCVKKGINQDLLNNDIPIFYYCAAKKAIFYHKEPITTKI